MSLGCAYDNGMCNKLSEVTKLNRLSERDISLEVSIAAAYIPGIDLNVALLDPLGYVANASSRVKDILDVGLRRLYLDVYWDRNGTGWHLCPFRPALAVNSTAPGGAAPNSSMNFSKTSLESNDTRASTSIVATRSNKTLIPAPAVTSLIDVFSRSTRSVVGDSADPSHYDFVHKGLRCDYNFGVSDLLSAIKEYIDLSDTNIAADLIHIHLRPKIWPDSPEPGTVVARGESSLNASISTIVGSRLYTSSNLASLKQGSKNGVADDVPRTELWPSLEEVLYTQKKRAIVTFNGTQVDQIPDLASLRSIAFQLSTLVSEPWNLPVKELSHHNFTDSMTTSVSDWVRTKKSGVSPVMAWSPGSDFENQIISLVENHGSWAWADGQPILYTTEEREQMLKDGRAGENELAACAVFSRQGFMVGDCNAHFRLLCKAKDDSFDWSVSSDKHTYFDHQCERGYKFSLPSTPLEARYVAENVLDNDMKLAWADLNSLFLPNCWVSGGTNAVCPYNVVQNDRNGIGYVIVAAVVSAVAALCILLFEWDRGKSPLMRRHGKRQKLPNQEYEGFPS